VSTILEIEQKEFDEKALQAQGLVVVDFSAKWCGPCKRMLPELEAVAQEFDGRATIVKVDVDESPEIAMCYGVQGIPNLTFLKGGEVVDVIVGLTPRTEIASRTTRNL
jgi:thioredoxin 1